MEGDGDAPDLELAAPYRLQEEHEQHETKGGDDTPSQQRGHRYTNEMNRLDVEGYRNNVHHPLPSSLGGAVEGFCIERNDYAAHPDYHHLPDWHNPTYWSELTGNTNGFLHELSVDPTVIPPKPQILSSTDDTVWNEFCDAMTRALQTERRDIRLIGLGSLACFLVLFCQPLTLAKHGGK